MRRTAMGAAQALAGLALLWVVGGCQSTNPSARADLDSGDGSRAADAGADAGRCAEGARCDDGDPCTEEDRCVAGRCGGRARPCDDGDPCTADTCDSARGCVHAPTGVVGDEGGPGGAECANGVDDDCDGLVDGDDADCRPCTGDADCVDANPCTAGTCDGGRCVTATVADGVECDDDDACTAEDACRAGICAGEGTECPGMDDPCLVPACAPETGACGSRPAEDGTACDDGDPCTLEDACLSGRCGGTFLDCRGLDQPCALGVCDRRTGACRAVPRSDGVPCGQADACLSEAACRAGACEGAETDCGALDDACRVAACDDETGACEVVRVPAGTRCDDADPCTVDDACGPAGCAGTALDCRASDGPCAVGRCDPEVGRCVSDPLPDGTACDDGLGCTENDRCSGGVCAGTARICDPPADTCSVVVCDAARGRCVVEARPDGVACDDGDACTGADACLAGRCMGRPVVCDDEDACTVDRCDAASGRCVAVRERREGPEGAPGDATCSNGRDDDCDGLVDLADPDCRACDEDAACAGPDPCETFVCDRGRCRPGPPARPGTPCDDGQGCTEADACQAGRCVGTPRVCPGGGPCSVGFCDPADGACRIQPRPDGTRCEDGDPCTRADVCAGAACAGTPLDCSGRDGECTVGVCDPATGACRADPRPDGTACNDGERCTRADRCRDGACGGTAVDCAGALAPCRVGLCDPASGACIARDAPDGAGCDDGDACTQEDTCTAGVCLGRPRDCRELDGACVVGRCNAADGQCRPVPRPDRTPCDDGSRCTADDACTGGVCAGTAPSCAELDGPCVAGRCDPASGRCFAEPVADGTRCDDGVACTANDVCTEGRCAGARVECGALDGPCVQGFCDAQTGACGTRPRPDGTACDDGQVCTREDRCAAGVCRGQGQDCSALNGVCVVGQCDPAGGGCVAAPQPDGTACNDADLCTTQDTCAGGACRGQPRDCRALDGPCVVGQCNPATGGCVAVPRPDGSVCDDRNVCTVNDRCLAGECRAEARTCAHLDTPCTVGVCEPGPPGGCVARDRPDGTGCASGDRCMEQEACRAGVCQGTPRVCPQPANACREAVCNPATGACANRNRADGTACEDGRFCTVGDRCAAGSCTAGPARDCNPPGEPCRIGRCNEDRDRCDVSNVDRGAACDDGLYCTVNTTCDGNGVCRGNARFCPPAEFGCKRGVCDEANDACGLVNAPDDQFCLDLRLCTTGERCVDGQCVPRNNLCD